MSGKSSETAKNGKLAVFCLGGLRIEGDGAPLTHWASRKAQALVAYLAITRHTHAREHLATLLWDNRPTRRALGNLSVVLSSLRANLGDLVVATRKTVGLDWEQDIWVDAVHLSRQLTILGGNQPGSNDLARLERVLTLYQGDFLDGFFLRQASGFEEWTLLERERLRQQVLQGWEKLVHGLLLRQRYPDGITYAQRFLAYDPLCERIHRDLMRLYTLDGQRPAALAQYEQCFEILEQELGVEPDDETIALYEQIATGDDVAAALPVESASAHLGRHNLPPALTSFVGRTAELNQIKNRLDNPACRLLTLLGVGGVGKTRLALHAARNRLGQHLDGVWFVSLASLDRAERLAAAIGAAMNLSFSGPTDSATQLLQKLKDREILLVLDNFEHLLADPADADEGHPALDLINAILAKAPEVKLLVTSRQRLALQAEWVLDVGGLPCPSQAEVAQAADYAAVQLLVQRGEHVRPDFHVRPENQADVVRICQLVDGLPLALELAASWLRTLSPGQIAAEIERSLDFLRAQEHDMPKRHSSQRAVFEGSWKMLSDPEQEAFRKLAVFRDGFTAEAAWAVGEATLSILSRLIDKSLIWRANDGRYHLHPLLRRFAAQKLATDPALEEACRNRHCGYYARLVSDLADLLDGPSRLSAVARLDAEIENVRAAWRWAGEGQRVDWLGALADGYGRYLVDSGLFIEGRTAFGQAAVVQEAPLACASLQATARLLTWRGIFERMVGTAQAAEESLQGALEILDRPELNVEDTRPDRARTLEELAAHCLHEKGEYGTAQSLYRQALALYIDLGDERGMGGVYNSLGVLAYYRGDYGEAQRFNQESLHLKRKNGDRAGLIRPLQVLGMTAVSQGHFTEGIEHLRKCLAHSRQEKVQTSMPWLLADLGYAFLLAGDLARAQATLSEGLRIGDERQEAQIVSVLHILLGFAHLHAGAYAAAQEHGVHGLDIAAAMDFHFEHAFAQLLLGSVALVQTDYAQANTLLSAAAQTYRAIEHVEYLAWALPLLACVACKQQRWSRGASHLVEAAGLLEELPAFAPSVLTLAGLRLWLGGQDAAQAKTAYTLAMRHPFVAHSRWFADVTGDEPDGEPTPAAEDATLKDALPGLAKQVLALVQATVVQPSKTGDIR